MRILLAMTLLAAACGGSKKSSATPEAQPETELRDEARPDDPDEVAPDSVDPCSDGDTGGGDAGDGADPCDGGE